MTSTFTPYSASLFLGFECRFFDKRFSFFLAHGHWCRYTYLLVCIMEEGYATNNTYKLINHVMPHPSIAETVQSSIKASLWTLQERTVANIPYLLCNAQCCVFLMTRRRTTSFINGYAHAATWFMCPDISLLWFECTFILSGSHHQSALRVLVLQSGILSINTSVHPRTDRLPTYHRVSSFQGMKWPCSKSIDEWVFASDRW